MPIRPADQRDYAALERLWAQQSALHVALHPDHLRRVDDYLSPEAFDEATSGPSREIAVLELAGEILGAAILRARTMAGKYTITRRVAHVDEIVIDERMRGEGHGRTLLEYVEGWARERGLAAVELNVWGRNREALGFYEALGYEPLRYEMHKRLDAGRPASPASTEPDPSGE